MELKKNQTKNQACNHTIQQENIFLQYKLHM